jgi:hypothetical protein
LWTAKKYTDVGGNYWGKNLLWTHKILALKKFVRYPKITERRQLSTLCVILDFRRGVNKIFCFSGILHRTSRNNQQDAAF